MKKDLRVEGYGADAEVKKVKYGYDVVIRIPFTTRKIAEECLEKIQAKWK